MISYLKKQPRNFHSDLSGGFRAYVFASALLMLVSVCSASAGDILFMAKLSEQDHFSSAGKRLATVAAIIRQDRANFHKYGKRDAGDTEGGYQTAAARANLEREIAKLKISPSLRKKILNGTPLIYVGADDDGTLSIGEKDWE